MFERWSRLGLFNLFLLSLLGVLLRYKAAFSLSIVNYKYLLNAHSHFAFTGWLTTIIFTALLFMLEQSGIKVSAAYRRLFWLNQVSVYGMLVSFIAHGYGPVSIAFSALSVIISYGFTILFWMDAARANWPKILTLCARLALVFLVISSAGPYLLAYSMSHAPGDMVFYYNAIYLFLHFQYNGWFSFAAIAAFLWIARTWSLPGRSSQWLVVSMGAACIPAYCLSLLWMEPPPWVWVLAAMAGLIQLAAPATLFWMLLSCRRRNSGIQPATRILWMTALLAFSIKIVLQALTVIPYFGRLAFGSRPVIIAYLHLVLLGFLTLFFLGFLLETKLVRLSSPLARAGLTCFVSGVVINEVLLVIQSLLGFAGHGWSGAIYDLYAAALLMAAGLACFAFPMKLKRNKDQAYP